MYNGASQEESLAEWAIVTTQHSQRTEARVLSTFRVSLSHSHDDYQLSLFINVSHAY